MKTLVTFLLSFLLFNPAVHAQWRQTNGPYGGVCSYLTSNGTHVFAGSYRSGVFRSTNNGAMWELVNTGLPKDDQILSLSSLGTILVTNTNHTVYTSIDNGEHWKLQGKGLPTFTRSPLVVSGTTLFVMYDSVLYRSIDSGAIWNKVNTDYIRVKITGYAEKGKNFFIAGYEPKFGTSIFLSTDKGIRWNAVDTGILMRDKTVGFMEIFDSVLYVSTGKGLFRSTNNGVSWIISDSSLKGDSLISLRLIENKLYAITNKNELYVSTNKGDTWSHIEDNNKIYTITGNKGTLFCGASDSTIIASTDNGARWKGAKQGFVDIELRTLFVKDSTIYAGTLRDGIFVSTDDGETWKTRNNGLESMYISSIVQCGETLYAGTFNGGIYYSTNNGAYWTKLQIETGNHSSSLLVVDSLIFSAVSSGVIRINHSTKTSQLINKDIKGVNITSLAIVGNKLYAGSNSSGMFESYDYGDTWYSIPSPYLTYVNTLYTYGKTLFAGEESGLDFTDDGQNWTHKVLARINANLTCPVNSFVQSATALFAGTNGGGVFRTVDSGNTWTACNIGLPSNSLHYALGIKGSTLYTGTRSTGVWKLDLNTLSAEDNQNTNGTMPARLTCYPNPASRTLTIDRSAVQVNENNQVHYTLSTIIGGKVMEFDTSESKFTLPITGIASGVYSLTAESGVMRTAIIITVVE